MRTNIIMTLIANSIARRANKRDRRQKGRKMIRDGKNRSYLINYNKRYRTVKTYDKEFVPRKQRNTRFVPDLLDRPKKG